MEACCPALVPSPRPHASVYGLYTPIEFRNKVCAVKTESKYNSELRPVILAKLLNQITNLGNEDLDYKSGPSDFLGGDLRNQREIFG